MKTNHMEMLRQALKALNPKPKRMANYGSGVSTEQWRQACYKLVGSPLTAWVYSNDQISAALLPRARRRKYGAILAGLAKRTN